jgi:orotate phosphoribosyltransferase
LILDDVITAGTSVRESVVIINDAGATPAGVLIALDRQEKGKNDISAIQEVSDRFDMPVVSIIALEHIIEFIENDDAYKINIETIKAYQQQYGL